MVLKQAAVSANPIAALMLLVTAKHQAQAAVIVSANNQRDSHRAAPMETLMVTDMSQILMRSGSQKTWPGFDH